MVVAKHNEGFFEVRGTKMGPFWGSRYSDVLLQTMTMSRVPPPGYYPLSSDEQGWWDGLGPRHRCVVAVARAQWYLREASDSLRAAGLPRIGPARLATGPIEYILKAALRMDTFFQSIHGIQWPPFPPLFEMAEKSERPAHSRGSQAATKSQAEDEAS